MKNNDQKPLVKSPRKAAAADIEQSLLATLKEAATKLGQTSKDFIKEIEKGSKKLAKKLSKQIEFEKPAKQEGEAAPKVEKVKPASKAKLKVADEAAPVVKKAAKKSEAPAKTAVVKVKPVKVKAEKTEVKPE